MAGGVAAHANRRQERDAQQGLKPTVNYRSAPVWVMLMPAARFPSHRTNPASCPGPPGAPSTKGVPSNARVRVNRCHCCCRSKECDATRKTRQARLRTTSHHDKHAAENDATFSQKLSHDIEATQCRTSTPAHGLAQDQAGPSRFLARHLSKSCCVQ